MAPLLRWGVPGVSPEGLGCSVRPASRATSGICGAPSSWAPSLGPSSVLPLIRFQPRALGSASCPPTPPGRWALPPAPWPRKCHTQRGGELGRTCSAAGSHPPCAACCPAWTPAPFFTAASRMAGPSDPRGLCSQVKAGRARWASQVAPSAPKIRSRRSSPLPANQE